MTFNLEINPSSQTVPKALEKSREMARVSLLGVSSNALWMLCVIRGNWLIVKSQGRQYSLHSRFCLLWAPFLQIAAFKPRCSITFERIRIIARSIRYCWSSNHFWPCNITAANSSRKCWISQSLRTSDIFQFTCMYGKLQSVEKWHWNF